MPGTYATNDEHLALADGMNDAGGGVFQAVLDFETRAGNEFQLIRAMAERGLRSSCARGAAWQASRFSLRKGPHSSVARPNVTYFSTT